MKTLNKIAFLELEGWMHRNARALELAVWNLHFRGGNGEDVLRELRHYQNSNGGFGNALEADCWNPESSPYTTMYATTVLQSCGLDKPGTPMVEEILRYLDSGAHWSEENGGWLFCIPTNDKYPGAPWWRYNEELNRTESTGITVALCGFVLRCADKGSPLYKKALENAQALVRKVLTPGWNAGETGITGFQRLLEDIRGAGLENLFDTPALEEAVRGMVDSHIQRDVTKWPGYTPRPSEYIHAPDSPFYPGNEDIVGTELDYLIDTRRTGGTCDITWQWFGMDDYIREFAVSENWIKGYKTIDHLLYLRAFDRLDNY